MTVQTFCRSGEQEEVKGAIHAVTGLLALAMATYNATAWGYRREPRLGANAIIYGAVALFEVKQTLHHLQRLTCEDPGQAAEPLPETRHKAA